MWIIVYNHISEKKTKKANENWTPFLKWFWK